MEQAISAGDIAWHAIPFTWQTELMDPSLIAGGLGFSQVAGPPLRAHHHRRQDDRRARSHARHHRPAGRTRSQVSRYRRQCGVHRAGCSAGLPVEGSRRPRSGDDVSLTDYGGIVKIPGSDLAVDVECRGDNRGPHTIEEIHDIYAGLRKQFPNAQVTAANLTDIANAVEPIASGCRS